MPGCVARCGGDVAIEPAGHRRAEKPTSESEKKRSAQAGKERGMAKVGGDAESDENDTRMIRRED